MANPTDSNAHFDPKVLKGKDDFFTAVYRFFDGLGKHTAVLAIVIGLVMVLGVVGGLMANRHEAKSGEAKSALFLAQKAYDTEMKSLAGIKAPAAGADEKAKAAEEAASSKRLDELSLQKFDVEAKLPTTVAKYKEVITQFGGTRAAHEARMGLGDLYFNHGDAAKAIPFYKEGADSAPGNFEKSLALSALGYAYENSGKPNDAVAAFEKALNLGEAGIKGDVLLAIARSQVALHDTAKARSTYDQIISQLPNTESAKMAEALKAKL